MFGRTKPQTVDTLIEEGKRLEDARRLSDALQSYSKALNLARAQKESGAEFWLLTVIGDIRFQLKEFAPCRASLMAAVVGFEDGRNNPFVRMRLGQCMYELGEMKEASNWLAGAYLSEGLQLFRDEDPKYVSFIKSQLKAPPEGWPEGW
jgi:tetratricopeptide (TPR) repeat protein